ncbi:hypothetical protein [Paenibacillus glacialis]|uniref:DUF5668 domain-containing protein n=1 Tax=Paenibacillus glacialis TaxID=494026 RepID=A0A162LT75_9BACL|nr:hypothetical protein [Paenibacillus glacialis]OAB33933.1 hypothetical protein PGLA_23785 [Paenibacillus glacialis]
MTFKKDVKLGLLIIIAGIVILLGKLGVFGFLGRSLWPLAILIPGLLLHALYFSRRGQSILLIPGGILTVWGLLFGICNIWGWGLMSHLWPALILGIAVGLYEYYIYESPRSSMALWVSIILGLLSIVLILLSLMQTGVLYLVSILLIAVGLWLILRRKSSTKSKW